MNTPVFSMERSLIKFKRQSLEKILIFSAKTNVFPPRGQDVWHREGGSRIMHTKRRGKTIRTIGFPRVNVNRKWHGWSISTGAAPEARPKGTFFDGSRPEGTSPCHSARKHAFECGSRSPIFSHREITFLEQCKQVPTSASELI